MSYIDSQLIPGETVIYRARHHKIIYAPAFLFSLLTLPIVVLTLALGLMTGQSKELLSPLPLLSNLGLLSLNILFWYGSILTVNSAEFGITTERIICKTGAFSTRTFELMLPQVESIVVNQGFFGSRFNFGTVGVGGTGGSKAVFMFVADPLRFRQAVQAQIGVKASR